MATTFSSRLLSFHLSEFVWGIICFSLFQHYGYIPCPNLQSWDCRIRLEIGTVAFDSFPLFILPILIAGHATHGNKFEYNIINPLFAFVGFILYVTAGSLQCSAAASIDAVDLKNEFNPSPFYALGAIAILTSFIFLGEMIYWIIRKRQPKE